jgi:predicted small lipoprotein YifL
MPIRTLVILLAVAVALAACGRRGALEPPGSADDVASPAAQTTAPVPGDPLLTAPVSPGAQEPAAARRETTPARPFVLDFLI